MSDYDEPFLHDDEVNVDLPGDDDDDEIYEIFDRRAFKGVDIDARVTDIYMPLLGAPVFGLYTAYIRLSSQQNIPTADKSRGALRYAVKKCRLSINTVIKYNGILAECGLIQVIVPTDWQKSRHMSNSISLLDPPTWPSAEIIAKYGLNKGKDYEPMCEWLYPKARIKREARSIIARKARIKIEARSRKTAKARIKIEAPIDDSAYQNRSAMTSSLIDSQIEDSIKNKSSDDDESEASVMESTDDAAFVRQVQVNLMAAAQQHGWFGSGFNWSKRERELALENREALTPELIAHAVDKWWEIKEPTERFDPCRSFPYIVAVCKNKKDEPNEPQWTQRNGASRNGRSRHDDTPAAWIRPVAELCAPGELNVYPDIIF